MHDVPRPHAASSGDKGVPVIPYMTPETSMASHSFTGDSYADAARRYAFRAVCILLALLFAITVLACIVGTYVMRLLS